MLEVSEPTAGVIVYAPGALVDVASLLNAGLPVTSEVPSVSPFAKPLNVAVNAGSAAPNARDAASAVTANTAFEIVSGPVAKVKL